MKNIRNNLAIATFAVSVVLLGGCSSEEQAAATDVLLSFAAQVNGADFACGQTYTGVGTGGDDLTISDFRLFIHDVHISHDGSGKDFKVELNQDGTWQLDDVAMLDFEDASGGCSGTAETNNVVMGTARLPAWLDTSSTEVCFTVGVPEAKNHIDPATAESPLNASGMLWAWKLGYKYIRIDAVGDPSGTPNNFNLHLGAQGCPAGPGTAPPTESCTVPNTFEVCIDHFDLENDVIAVDPAFVFEGNDVSVNLNGGAEAKPGCQSFINDDDCVEIMPRLGLDYEYGATSPQANNSTYSGGQRLFSKQ